MKDAQLFLGARGLATKIYTDESDPMIDPLSAENKLVFCPGPFTGTLAPSGGRYHVVCKSPLTGTIASANSGGSWGAELRYAGYDALIVEGKSETPVYIRLKDDKVEFRDASHLWGKWVSDTTDMVRAETDIEAKVACVGPAGGKKVLFAAIMNEMHRAAGRGGVGAVMGSKNLKAIAIVGTKGVKVADPKALKDTVLASRAAQGASGGAGPGPPWHRCSGEHPERSEGSVVALGKADFRRNWRDESKDLLLIPGFAKRRSFTSFRMTAQIFSQSDFTIG